jgi:hypothetical protein
VVGDREGLPESGARHIRIISRFGYSKPGSRSIKDRNINCAWGDYPAMNLPDPSGFTTQLDTPL